MELFTEVALSLVVKHGLSVDAGIDIVFMEGVTVVVSCLL